MSEVVAQHIPIRARYQQVVAIFARHGLGFLVGRDSWKPRHVPAVEDAHETATHARAVHLRMALEELGVVFIKLGQMASTRADWLPEQYQHELSKLQDDAPPVSASVIHKTIESEFNEPVETLFRTFDDTPLAAASIGQVHAATLRTGQEVVVKVRRPDIITQVETDLLIIQRIAASLTRRSALAASYDVEGIAAEFAKTLRAELDYEREARNAEQIARNLATIPYAAVPPVYAHLCSTSVLTLGRLHGIKISDRQALLAAGHDCGRIAREAAELELHMIVEDGFYHADPHPGNFVITPSGAIGLMDFGMVGTVSARVRTELAEILIALADHDMDALVDTLLEMGVTAPAQGRTTLARDFDRVLGDIYEQSLGELPLGPIIRNMLSLLRTHRLRMPSNLSLLFKTIVMSEALGTQLDPNFRITSVLEPYSRRLIRTVYGPREYSKRLMEAGPDVLWLGSHLPRHLRRLTGELERGTIQIGIQHDQLDALVNRIESIANRLVIGMLVTAFIIGLAVLLSVYRPGNSREWLDAFFAIGLIAALVLGAVLLRNLVRSERRRIR